MRPRRLLTLGHSYVVAANRRLAHEMARAGGERWSVTCAAPRAFHGTRDLFSNTLVAEADEPCRLVPLPAHLSAHVHLFLYGRGLATLLAEGWDVVHAWEEPFVLAGGEVALLAPRAARLVYRTAQSIPKAYPPPFGWVERYALARASGWICSGRLVEEALAERRGYRGLPHRRIPLGVDVDAFRPDPTRGRALLAELGWDPAGPPVVGFLGRLSSEKGISLLLRAIDALATPWRALIVGAGPLATAAEQWAAGHGPARARVLTGVRHADVPRVLNAMDLLCAPSQTTPAWKEQFGRMLVEAFAAGVCVLGSDSGEVPFVIEDAGLVVPERDEPAWTRAIGDLLESPGRRAELAARGLERARARFAWPAVARQYLEFFDQLT